MQKSHRTARPLSVILTILAATVSLSGCSALQNLPLPWNHADSSTGTTNAAPSSSTATPTGKPDAKQIKSHLEAGNKNANSGQWQAALNEYQQVLSTDPRNAQAHAQSGWALAELKQWEEAKNHLTSAIALNPENGSAHATLAWVYAEQKHWNESQEEAKKAIDLDPKNAYPHATLAWGYQSTGQDDLAVDEYAKSLELNPKLDQSSLALGIIYCNQGQKPRADELLNSLIKQGSPKASELQGRIKKGCGVKK